MRYFLAAYSYSNSNCHGSGNLWFRSEKFPSNVFLKEGAARFSNRFKKTDVVVINIVELSEADFSDFCEGASFSDSAQAPNDEEG